MDQPSSCLHFSADETGFEPVQPALQTSALPLELFVHFVGPGRLELPTPGVKDRYSDPFELRTIPGALRDSNPVLLGHNQVLYQ